MTMSEQIMTRDDVKEYFGIKETTLCKMISTGQLPLPTHLGRKTIWFKSSIEKAVDCMRRASERTMEIRNGRR